MRKVVRGVGIVSVGKIAGLLYAAIGLLIGLVVAGISLLGGVAALAQGDSKLGMFFGVGAIILFPMFYGTIGALMAMLMAAIYNLVAGMIGGIELEVD